MIGIAKNIDLKKQSIPSLFFSYFIPSLFTMLALSTYSVVDGIFVGNKIGGDGLAAVGIAWPIFPIIISLELLLSFGGATLSSYYLGRNQGERARQVFTSVFCTAIVLCIFLSILCFVKLELIVTYLGSSEKIKPYVIDYLGVIFLGLSFLILHPLIDVFAVNDRRPLLVSVSMVISSACNIVLNYYFLFVVELGIKGAALATVIAHFLGFIIVLSHFLIKKGDLYFVFPNSFFHTIKDVLLSIKTGISESTAELSASIVMFLFNLHLMSVMQDRGVAIYATMMYSGIVFFTLLISIAQSLQPIVSYSYGAGLFDRVRQTYIFCLKIVICIGIVLYVLFNIFSEDLASLFLHSGNQDLFADFVHDVSIGMKIYFIGYIFLGVNILSAVFLQSVRNTLSSFIVTLFYTIIFVAALLPILKHFFGIYGIWLSNPIAQILSIFVVFIAIKMEFRALKIQEKRIS